MNASKRTAYKNITLTVNGTKYTARLVVEVVLDGYKPDDFTGEWRLEQITTKDNKPIAVESADMAGILEAAGKVFNGLDLGDVEIEGGG